MRCPPLPCLRAASQQFPKASLNLFLESDLKIKANVIISELSWVCHFHCNLDSKSYKHRI